VAGDTVIVGSAWHDPPATPDAGIGAAYVFTRSGNVWTQQQELTAADGASSDVFGFSVAMSADTAAIGAPGHLTDAGDDGGVVYVFTRTGATWTQQQELAATGTGAGDQVGHAVAVSGDTVITGAPYADTAAGNDAGAAWVFTRTGAAWTQQQKLTPAAGSTAGDHFGWSVAVSGDRAVVGAPWFDLPHTGHDPEPTDAGSAFVYVRWATTWSQDAVLALSDGYYNDWYGNGVGLSGQTAIVGAPWRDLAGGNTGGAYVYVFDSVAPVTTATVTPAPNAAGWNTTPVTVTLTATDEPGGSGVAAIEYRQKGAAEWVPYTSPFAVITFGISGWEYRATDLAGNVEPAELVTVRIAPLPAIAALRPTSGRRRAVVTITGTGFGTERGVGFVTFGSRRCTAYVLWSDTAVKCRVPARAAYGKVKVRVTTVAGVSTGRSFRVKR
jgi:hypothetical protein